MSLWKAEELMTNHGGYKVKEFFPNFFFVGTDGGDAYAVDTSTNDATIFDVPFTGMPADARPIADSFEALLDPSQQIDL